MIFDDKSILIVRVNFQDFYQDILFFKEILNESEKSSPEPFIIRRGILRCLLSNLTGLAYQEIDLVYNQYGKPFLKSKPQICFNLSSSEGKIVYAFAYECDVGIDIQYRGMNVHDWDVCSDFLSQEELSQISMLSEHHEKQILFYDLWAQKESILKTTGKGFSGNFFQKSLNTRVLPCDENYSLAISSQKYLPVSIKSIASLFEICPTVPQS
jgi:phosphopantetheinyl transferase